jgi:hypothetical protein
VKVVEDKKRVTVSFEGELLEWMDRKIEENVFHNYQHAVDYCLMKVYKTEYTRFTHYNVYEDHATIYDDLRKRIVDVYFREDPYCEECGTSDCEHVRFALSLPKVVEPLIKKGWTIMDGRVISKPG